MINSGQLGTSLMAALAADGAERVLLRENEFEVPYLDVVMDRDSRVPVNLWFEEGEPVVLRLEIPISAGLPPTGESDTRGSLEFILRIINDLNRLEATPWKFWMKGMQVEFEGVMTSKSPGEVWATWSLPAGLLSVDDVPYLCHWFSAGVARLALDDLFRA